MLERYLASSPTIVEKLLTSSATKETDEVAVFKVNKVNETKALLENWQPAWEKKA